MFTPKIELNSALKSCPPQNAQAECNFVLFKTSWIPEGTKIADQQLRPESAEGRSSYRFILIGQNRKLSIKQFLYDWAPPAYDHPSLWRNAKISPINKTPTPRFFHINKDVAWIGLNFRRQPALSLNIQRTMIEMTVIEGTFTDDELVQICKGLTPVDVRLRDLILSTPFAHLCYSHRHPETASNVPLSYWKYTRKKTWPVSSISQATESIQIPPSYGYFLNSVFSFGEPKQEIEYLYEHRDVPGSYIRLLATPPDQKNGIAYPPRLGDRVCSQRNFQIGGQKIYHAFLREEVGPHEVIWQHKDCTVLLLIKPAKWTSLAWFDQFIQDVIGGSKQP